MQHRRAEECVHVLPVSMINAWYACLLPVPQEARESMERPSKDLRGNFGRLQHMWCSCTGVSAMTGPMAHSTMVRLLMLHHIEEGARTSCPHDHPACAHEMHSFDLGFVEVWGEV